MSDNNKEINPLTNIIYGKKNQSNLTNLTNLTNTSISRRNVSFYLLDNLNTVWRQYCKMSGKGGCWLLEEALLEYMRAHPLTQAPLIYTQDIRIVTPDIKYDLKLGMVKQELRYALNLIKDKEPRIIRDNLPRLRRAVNRALGCRSSDEELTSMLERAGGYLK